MQFEFVCSNEVMLTKVLRLLSVVIRVVDFNLEFLRLLKMEIDQHLLNKLRIQVVMDHFRLPQNRPLLILTILAANQLVKDAKRIRLGESVQIG